MSKPLLLLPRSLVLRVTLALLASAIAVSAAGQDRNISHPIPVIEKLLAETPLQVVEMEQARPSIQDDRSIRIVLDGADGAAPITAKLKPVGSSAMGYNNEPRYDLAAYRLQTLFLDEEEYVVPPIV